MSEVVTSFNETISPNHPIYKPEKDRYWLYVSGGCPFASRALTTRAIKGLNEIIGVSITHWMLGDDGFKFLQADPKEMGDNAYRVDGGVKSFKDDTSTPIGNIPDDSSRLFVDGSFDPHYGAKSMEDLYMMSNPNYKGKYSVPILWDLKTKTIVNNDSGEIIRILNNAFNEFIDPSDEEKNVDLAPTDIIPKLDEYNKWLGPNINMGVYNVGLADNQATFEEETIKLYKSLDEVELNLKTTYNKLAKEYGESNEKEILKRFYLFANHLTDTDIRLYTTMIRFDSIYVNHFKCNYKTIRNDYTYISKWLKNLYWNHPSFRGTTSFNHIKLFYSRSRKLVNPICLIPLGPEHDIEQIQK